MKRLSLAVVIIHHSSKIHSRKFNAAGRFLSHEMKMVVQNQVFWGEGGLWGFFCFALFLSQVLWNWFMMCCKKQSSDVISSSRLQNIMCAPRSLLFVVVFFFFSFSLISFVRGGGGKLFVCLFVCVCARYMYCILRSVLFQKYCPLCTFNIIISVT